MFRPIRIKLKFLTFFVYFSIRLADRRTFTRNQSMLFRDKSKFLYIQIKYILNCPDKDLDQKLFMWMEKLLNF